MSDWLKWFISTIFIFLLIFLFLSFNMGRRYGRKELKQEIQIELLQCSDKNICRIKTVDMVIYPNGTAKIKK